MIFWRSLGWLGLGLFKIELSNDDEEDDELDDDDDDDGDELKLSFCSSFCDNEVLNRVITFRQANSVESTWACLNLFRTSWKLRISDMILRSFSGEVVSEFRPAWANNEAISNGIWYWAADRMNTSLQPSSSNDS